MKFLGFIAGLVLSNSVFSTSAFALSATQCVGASLAHDISVKVTPMFDDPTWSRFEYYFGDADGQHGPIRFSGIGASLEDGHGYYTVDSRNSGMDTVELAIDGLKGLLKYSLRGESVEEVPLDCVSQ